MLKQVVLLVGPPGAGKSTFCKESLNNHFRISQDEMGQKEHWNVYLKALKTESLIVVDRINHTKAQRAKYLDEARKHGYETKIIEIFQTFGMCATRCLARKDHPTIQSYDTAIKALTMYFNQYEIIKYTEADQVLRSVNNPIVTDLTEEFIAGKRFIIIGDLHGCYDELNKLLKEVNYNQETDIIVFAGDLGDRGPKIVECFNFLVENDNVYSVQGNHDNKWMRWLNQNKVNPESLKETIEQFDFSDNSKKTFLYEMLMNKLSNTIIKIGFNYITHAGFHPYYMPEETSREFSLYARNFDEKLGTFSRFATKPWYEMDFKHDYNMFFGHQVHEDKFCVAPNIYALDAGCVFGGKLRCALLDKSGLKYHEIKSSFSCKKDVEYDYMNKFEPYERLVEQKYLRKQESGSLVLYNYSEACTYEKYWNEYTMECRGLILDKNTSEVVARPFSKFFNVSELESPSLPKIPVGETYEVYSKEDGSLGILYFHPDERRYKIATRGSFESDQAKKATEMWHKRRVEQNDYTDMSWNDNYELLLKQESNLKDYTLLFEIIYPENRMNDGARLVVNYGEVETLILLGAVHKVTGKDIDHQELMLISDRLGMPLVVKYDYTIEQLQEMKKTLPMQEEGWVVRFQNGFRVKVKGDEYCKMARILNSINPLAIWEVMKENKVLSNRLELPYNYKMNIPEEILPEVNELETKVKECFIKANSEIADEYNRALMFAKSYYPDNIKKGLGIQLDSLKHRSAIFLIYNEDWQSANKYVMDYIRPTNNKFNEVI